MKLNKFIALILLASLVSCAGSKTNVLSGKVTEKGHFKAGVNSSINISTIGLSITGLDVTKTDTIYTDTSIIIITRPKASVNSQKILLSQVLDPISLGTEYYINYGIVNNVDAGFKFDNSGIFLSSRYQFMGNKSNLVKSGMDANIGVEGSYHKFIQDEDEYDTTFVLFKTTMFFYDMTRKNIKIPITMSKGLGENEKYGHLGFGMVYNYSL